ncbi:DNA photolyase family protein [Acidiphilium sp. AL]|uniref:DNA photolyase family protein n=1 Tax=Acidiphilium iwatense TaxID=768198 RepID=A0ABS9DW87_9PROT|nr:MULTISPECIES: deoxyribodipyrimidine photo-lyase [Acidiphilium]MCF3945941.1 DNA photolyase family protein [Acidiphilium iwatense]MCU4159178.1 DNA photolyase family protein [Acidiphilium sp. AL]
MAKALLWLRNDLRLADNPALAAALDEGEVVPLYVLDPVAKLGGASLWWLHHSLASLRDDIAGRGGHLVVRRGDATKIVPALARKIGAVSVHAGQAHEPWLRESDRAAAEALARLDIPFHRQRSALLLSPEHIASRSGDPYRVYTPFSRAAFDAVHPRSPIAPPDRLAGGGRVESERLEDWGLLPTQPDWADGLRGAWTPGEAGAWARLGDFLEDDLAAYARERDRPDRSGTSRLSPHLHWGEISIDAVWREASAAKPDGSGKQTYLKELLWREFAGYLLWHNPKLAVEPLRAEYASFPWRRAPAELRAWQHGRTGIPIVDAGMRQLWQTGWMHNRMRMVTASFLVKHLLIPWQEGAAWFWDCLVDADAANNAASWQWVAGCGTDAAPYFRVFNPVLQGWKFDPDGAYVREFMPELAQLPDKFIQNPWEAPEDVLREAGVTLGKTYPRPIVDLKSGRNRALAAFKEIGGKG